MEEFNDFVRGAVAMGYAAAGLFFLRFYVRTRDRLFIMFCIALWLLGIIRLAMVLVNESDEDHYFYWLRLVAYVLILIAIIDKNLPRTNVDSAVR